MRLQILSDLHLEFDGNAIPPLAENAELVVLAGDLAPASTHRIGDIAETWSGARHILYVPGNHEYYGADIEDARRELAAECERHGVTLLDPGAIAVGDVHFIGATLWTDFRLDGAGSEPWAHRDVGENLADFTGAIRDRTAEGGLLTTHETARRHAEDRAFIEAELSKARDAGLAAVVITHHAPSPRCVRPWFASSPLNAGFASDLEETIARFRPALWIHGHMHDPIDETLGETRVIANPRGYPGVEGRDFDPALVLEV